MAKKPAKKNTQAEQPEPAIPPIQRWGHIVALAWILPGGGHFLQKRHGRGAILAGVVTLTFLFGIFMRGMMFEPKTGDLLTTVIHVGGFLCNVCSGVLYLLTNWLNYAQPDVAGHVHDYGTKFLVAAGLMNVLAMVDAYEIAIGKRS